MTFPNPRTEHFWSLMEGKTSTPCSHGLKHNKTTEEQQNESPSSCCCVISVWKTLQSSLTQNGDVNAKVLAKLSTVASWTGVFRRRIVYSHFNAPPRPPRFESNWTVESPGHLADITQAVWRHGRTWLPQVSTGSMKLTRASASPVANG